MFSYFEIFSSGALVSMLTLCSALGVDSLNAKTHLSSLLVWPKTAVLGVNVWNGTR